MYWMDLDQTTDFDRVSNTCPMYLEFPRQNSNLDTLIS